MAHRERMRSCCDGVDEQMPVSLLDLEHARSCHARDLERGDARSNRLRDEGVP
jgi:hypothetical protein